VQNEKLPEHKTSTDGGMNKLGSVRQCENASDSIRFRFDPASNERVSSEVQPLKLRRPIILTDAGMQIDVSITQLSNVSS
jgi:hypothetical protein